MGQEGMRPVVSALPMPQGLREHFGLVPFGGGVRRMLRASESLRELLIHLSTETRISRGKRQRATFAGHHPFGYLDLLDERLLKLVSRLVETGLVTYGHPGRRLPVGGLRQEAHFQTIPRGADR